MAIPLANHLGKRIEELAVPPSSLALLMQDLQPGLRSGSLSIGAVRRESVVNIGELEDRGCDGNLGPAQPIGVTRTIVPLVVMADNR